MDDVSFTILFVDDEPDIISVLKRMFRKKNYRIFTAGNGNEALDIVKNQAVDIAIIDLKMPGIPGIMLLEDLKNEDPNLEVIILTAFGAVEEAVKAMKLGAADFFEKPVKKENLIALVERIEKIRRLEFENRCLKEQIDFSFGFDHLVGYSTPVTDLKNAVKKIAPTDSSVLICGETGTGKELVARALHKISPRNGHAFVTVDCAAISDSLIESELFGYIKGAFTGAHDSSPGLVRSADKGTLFFDEIGELPNHVQAKLLRIIQEKEVRPVGSTRTHKVDVRIIAATNRDLKDEVRNNNFREDLFYRLNVISLIAPPLRDRTGDIPRLVQYFLKKFAFRDMDYHITAGAMKMFEQYDWPGNIRELENAIRRLTAFAAGDVIDEETVEKHLDYILAEKPPAIDKVNKIKMSQDDSLRSYEKRAILNALAKSAGNRKKAAEILGIGEATLYRKLKNYLLVLPRFFT